MLDNLDAITSTVPVTNWARANKVIVDNTYGQAPNITFGVEQAQLINNAIFSSVATTPISVAFDPTAVYPLISPVDNSVIDPNGGTHSALQAQLYSLFMHMASQLNQP